MSDSTLPTFSVIIPTHGRPKPLAECLESLSLLDYPRDRFDVVVVDDGSPQPIDAVVAALRDRLAITLIRQSQSGPGNARNTAVAHATGRFLAFLDDDCTAAPDWLRCLAVALTDAPDCVVGGRIINGLPGIATSTASQLLISYLYQYFNPDPDNAVFFAGNNFAMSAGGYGLIGGNKATMMLAGAEDREFFDRWVHAGRRMIYAPEALICHAHAMNLRQFCCQHFRYGRGACLFHGVRTKRGGAPLNILPLRFYVGLVLYPLGKIRGVRALWLAGLMAASQAATMAGYFYERFHGPRDW